MSRWCRVLFSILLALSVGAQLITDDEEFTCVDFDGYFAHPTNCRKFYQCVGDFPYRQDCPSGLYFDDIRKQCDFKDAAVCGPVTTTPGPSTTEDPYKATDCDPASCPLPNCYCSKDGTRIPGDLDRKETPQMIILALDGAVNGQNYNHYLDVFNDTIFKNPNECPMRGTFFVSHEYTNYQMVQDLYHKGHEIALYSMTARDLSRKSYDEWVQEMVGMRTMLGLWANVSEVDVLGMRAPQLKPGSNKQFNMMEDYGFVWDSSVSVPPVRTPIWPYTLDYKIPHDCRSGGCPTSQFPGIWEVPLNSHYVENFDGGHCPYLDQCVLFNFETSEVVAWFQEDFNRHYEQNRAPYILSFHTNWFNEAHLIEGLNQFLQWAQKKDDVWFVTMTQALLWISSPVPTNQLSQLEDWDCRKRQEIPAPACNLPTSCRVAFKPPTDSNEKSWKPGTRYMSTCFQCPKQYPWLYDVDGDGGEPDYYEAPLFEQLPAEGEV